MPQVIRFYYVDGEYGAFSNFAPYPIDLDGKTWPTAEHYYQAQKFAGTTLADAIRNVASPMKAARMGRDPDRPPRPDWAAVKDDVMRLALRAKFTQHDELRKLLLDTGDALIVERSKSDSYWGDGGDGSGRNRLGHILMEIRAELRDGA